MVTTRKLAAALGLALVALTAVLGAMVSEGVVWGYRQDGPIRYEGAAGVRAPVAAGTTFSWTMGLGQNPTSDDVAIEAIDPVGVTGLEVLGTGIAYGCGLPTVATGYPPAGMMVHRAEGTILPARYLACEEIPTAVIGLRRPTGAAPGAIDGLRLRYVSGGIRYETVLAWRFETKEPEP